MSDLLTVDGLSTGYGDVQAVWDVSLAVRSGEVTVLLGPNGAGKTTVLSAVMGLLPAWHGHITMADHDVTGTTAHYRARHGIALVQEGKRVFRRRTIEENLLLGGYPTTHNRKRLREGRLIASGTPDEIQQNPVVLESYIGTVSEVAG